MKKLGGRQKGTPNQLTTSFRQAVRFAYNSIGGHEAFSNWAAKHPTEFYKIAARLIPAEMTDSETDPIRVIINGVRYPPEQTQVTSPLRLPGPAKADS